MSPEFREGQILLGKYRVERVLGTGGMGVVLAARHEQLGTRVALKVLLPEMLKEPIATSRFLREARAAAQLHGDHVARVIDVGTLDGGAPCMVMEYLEGEDLSEILRRQERLSVGNAVDYAIQACAALSEAHAAGVVHRDVKPSNVFLAVDRDDPAGPERVKLLDFGIARVEWEETRITNTGGPLGTPGYMSPEQELGNNEVDGRSDLFALGAMLFECLVGEPPPPRSPSGSIPAGTNVPLRFESGTQKSGSLVPPKWRAIIERAMQLNPTERYQDARAFAQDLRAVREDIAEAEGSS